MANDLETVSLSDQNYYLDRQEKLRAVAELEADAASPAWTPADAAGARGAKPAAPKTVGEFVAHPDVQRAGAVLFHHLQPDSQYLQPENYGQFARDWILAFETQNPALWQAAKMVQKEGSATPFSDDMPNVAQAVKTLRDMYETVDENNLLLVKSTLKDPSNYGMMIGTGGAAATLGKAAVKQGLKTMALKAAAGGVIEGAGQMAVTEIQRQAPESAMGEDINKGKVAMAAGAGAALGGALGAGTVGAGAAAGVVMRKAARYFKALGHGADELAARKAEAMMAGDLRAQGVPEEEIGPRITAAREQADAIGRTAEELKARGMRPEDAESAATAQVLQRPPANPVEERLDARGLSDVEGIMAATVTDTEGKEVEAFSSAMAKVVAVSEQTKDVAGAVDHEVIHVLRRLKNADGTTVLSPEEWKVVEDAARVQMEARAPKLKEMYPELDNEGLLEEIVAEDFRAWAKMKESGGKEVANPVVRKMADVLEKLVNWFRSRGWTSREAIYDAIRTGEVGRRSQRESARKPAVFEPAAVPLTKAQEDEAVSMALADNMPLDDARREVAPVDELTPEELALQEKEDFAAFKERNAKWYTEYQQKDPAFQYAEQLRQEKEAAVARASMAPEKEKPAAVAEVKAAEVKETEARRTAEEGMRKAAKEVVEDLPPDTGTPDDAAADIIANRKDYGAWTTEGMLSLVQRLRASDSAFDRATYKALMRQLPERQKIKLQKLNFRNFVAADVARTQEADTRYSRTVATEQGSIEKKYGREQCHYLTSAMLKIVPGAEPMGLFDSRYPDEIAHSLIRLPNTETYVDAFGQTSGQAGLDARRNEFPNPEHLVWRPLSEEKLKILTALDRSRRVQGAIPAARELLSESNDPNVRYSRRIEKRTTAAPVDTSDWPEELKAAFRSRLWDFDDQARIRVNYENLDMPEAQQGLMQMFLDSKFQKAVWKQVSGKGDWDEIEKSAKYHDARLAVAKMLRVDEQVSTPELKAAHTFVAQGLSQLEDAIRIAKADPSAENVMAVMQIQDVLAASVPAFHGTASRAGKTLNFMRALKRGSARTPVDIKTFLAGAYASRGGREMIETNLNMLNDLFGMDNPWMRVGQYMRDLDGKWWTRAQQGMMDAFRGSVLASPKSMARNLNSIPQLVFYLGNNLMSAATSDESAHARLMDSWDAVVAMKDGLGDAFAYAASVMRSGKNPRFFDTASAVDESLTVPRASTAYVTNFGRDAEVAKFLGATKIGKLIDLLGGMSDAVHSVYAGADALNQMMYYNAELRIRAQQQARADIASGAIKASDYGVQVKRYFDAPLETMKDAAVTTARDWTFTGPPGSLARSLTGIKRDFPLSNIVLMFVQTPAEIFRHVTETNPVTAFGGHYLFKDGTKWGRAAFGPAGRERDMAWSKMWLGTAVTATFAGLYATGRLTGSGPRDPERRKVWLLENQPFSFQPYGPGKDKLKISYIGAAGPLEIVAGITANVGQVITEMGHQNIRDKSMQARVESLVYENAFAAASTLFAASYLSRFGNFMAALSQGDIGKQKQFFLQTASSAVPGSGLLRWASDTSDPYVREVNDITEALMNEIPYVREQLGIRRDFYGDPIRLTSDTWMEQILPVSWSSEGVDHPFTKEMKRLAYFPGEEDTVVSFRIPGSDASMPIDLTQFGGAHSRLIEIGAKEIKDPATGKNMVQFLDDLVTGKDEKFSRAYQGWDAAMKVRFLSGTIAWYRRQAKAQLLKERPKILEQFNAQTGAYKERVQALKGSEFIPEE